MLEKLKSESQSEETLKVQARAKMLYGQQLPYNGHLKQLTSWRHDSLLREVSDTAMIFYSVNNLNLFLREMYTPGQNGKQASHRQAFYCQRCIKIYYSDCQALKDHESICRGKGYSGR